MAIKMLRTSRLVCLVALVAAILLPATVNATLEFEFEYIDDNGETQVCTLTFQALTNRNRPRTDLQGQRDEETVLTTIRVALESSGDMGEKLTQACERRGNQLRFEVFRDLDGLVHAAADPLSDMPGALGVDLGDIDVLSDYLDGGGAAAQRTVINNFLTRILAHEIDHLRDPPGLDSRDHADPAGRAKFAMPGPAVTDANRVISELFANVDERRKYGKRLPGGREDIEFFVGDRRVIYRAQDHVEAEHAARRGGQRRFFEVHDRIPDRPCPEGAPCFLRIGDTDGDHDGVLDTDDNCPNLPNPQQGKLDCE